MAGHTYLILRCNASLVNMLLKGGAPRLMFSSYVFMHAHIHTYTHTHIHTYTSYDTHTHTYMHTQYTHSTHVHRDPETHTHTPQGAVSAAPLNHFSGPLFKIKFPF